MEQPLPTSAGRSPEPAPTEVPTRPPAEPPDPLAGAYHYGVIARAIAAIDAAGGATVPLPQLAADLGMSPAHFQRIFSAWAGVSPKRYQQYLALDHAKRLLGAQASTLSAAHGAGLSGTGRLHDLFVRWEAMRPGDYARRGAGLTIREGVLQTAFGPAVAMVTDLGLCGLGFAGTGDPAATRAAMRRRWPAARFEDDQEAATETATDALGGRGSLHVMGAPFQIKVWEALLAIPEGQAASYGEIAARIGRPKAARATGTAIGQNPVAWLIPCHRALRKGGGLGGYHWGVPVKRAMLAWEAARTDAA